LRVRKRGGALYVLLLGNKRPVTKKRTDEKFANNPLRENDPLKCSGGQTEKGR